MRTTLAAILCMLAAGCSGIADPETEKAHAERVVEQWVSQRSGEWTVNLTGRSVLTRPEWSRPCGQDPLNNFTALQYRARDVDLLFFFNCPVRETSSMHGLNDAFAFMVIDELPHGMRSAGWHFLVSTPTSSFTEQVMFSTPRPATLRVDVVTPLFAVLGRSTRPACEPLVDSPQPPQCYLHRPFDATLRLTLTVPFSGRELQ